MLTVWCVYVGNKYPLNYVYNLRRMVRHNLKIPFQFKCISDRHIPLIDTVPALPQFSVDPEKLWFHKLSLFFYADGPSLYFDLDTIIWRDVEKLVPYTNNLLSMPANWSLSGHGGWQSSVMAWSGALREPFERWNVDAVKRLWGDQELISEVMGNRVTAIDPALVLSYKYHIQLPGLKQPPANAVAITFHGKPDYTEVNDEWVQQSLSTPIQPYSTNSNLGNTSSPDSSATASKQN